MHKTWVVGDPHFGHDNILNFAHRPFHCIEEHDEHLISQINFYVARTDRLIIAGDVAWKDPQKYRMQIKCKQVDIVWGNHDKKSWAPCFSNCYDNLMLKLGDDWKLFISHYPHAYWPESHRGQLHVYGHVHDAREETLDRVFPGRRSMDVGFDTAKRILGEYRPFCTDEILNLLKNRPGHDTLDYYQQFDEHRRTYQIDSQNQVVMAPPSMETRPATAEQVRQWSRNRRALLG